MLTDFAKPFHSTIIWQTELHPHKLFPQYSSVQSVQFSHSVVSDSLQPHESQHSRPPCLTPTPEFTQIRVHRVSDAIQPSYPQSSLSSPVPNPSQHQSLSNESTLCMRWPKYWSFSFSIIPSEEIPGLISFRMDWLDLLAVQGTLKSLLQHQSSKASILWLSAFFRSTLTSIYNYWKNHSFDYLDPCWNSDVSTF